MTDMVNFVMLVAASIGSMALGILAAYGVLRAGFALMKQQEKGLAPVRALVPRAEQEAEIVG
ncbi:MAG: hypothetical protein ABSF53_08200 [Terracidiphilus sp.]|jgi:hypothetical protein